MYVYVYVYVHAHACICRINDIKKQYLTIWEMIQFTLYGLDRNTFRFLRYLKTTQGKFFTQGTRCRDCKWSRRRMRIESMSPAHCRILLRRKCFAIWPSGISKCPWQWRTDSASVIDIPLKHFDHLVMESSDIRWSQVASTRWCKMDPNYKWSRPRRHASASSSHRRCPSATFAKPKLASQPAMKHSSIQYENAPSVHHVFSQSSIVAMRASDLCGWEKLKTSICMVCICCPFAGLSICKGA